MPDWLELTQPASLSTFTVLTNLCIAMVVGVVVGWHFVRFGKTLGDRRSLARVLPAIMLTTVLIISVVKASLALSLGLVGALSIVRFRTPIKEPEELAYLFLSIAAGLGLGADQRAPTLGAVATILVLMTIHARVFSRRPRQNLFLNVELPTNGEGEALFPKLSRTVADHVETANVRRMDVSDHVLQTTFSVDCPTEKQMFDVVGAIQASFPAASVSLIDQSQTPEG